MFAMLENYSFIMAENMTATAVSLLCLLCLTSAQQEQCSDLIGSNNAETVSTPSSTQLFYLNTANPAPCTGSVTSWRVCYYGPDAINSVSLVNYWATYAVYRRMGSGSNIHYVRVSEMFRAIRTNADFISIPEIDGEISHGGFNCYTDSLDAGDSPLTIQAGDILGACVFDPDGDIMILNAEVKITLPLDVVGEVSGESLLKMNTDGCSRQALPSDIPANQLTPLNSSRLHIYANIGAESTTTHAQAQANVTTTIQAISTNETEVNNATGTLTTTTNPIKATILLSPQTPISNITTTKSTPISITDTKGSQAGRATGIIAGIIAGSTAGGLIILLLLVAIVSTVVYLMSKRKILSANAKDNCNTSVEKSRVDDIVTNTNPAYMSIQRQRATANHEFEVVCDTSITDIGETTTELQESNESRNSKLIMERNVAYEDSTTVQISLHLNVAYYESRKAFINVNHQANDQDYV